MKKAFSILVFLFIILLLTGSVGARSGCCSHHGGVNGCQCGDGSPLSTTCLPYYPECNAGGGTTYVDPTNTPIPWPTRTPTPWPTNTDTPTPTVVILPSKIPTKAMTLTKKTVKKRKALVKKSIPTPSPKPWWMFWP